MNGKQSSHNMAGLLMKITSFTKEQRVGFYWSKFCFVVGLKMLPTKEPAQSIIELSTVSSNSVDIDVLKKNILSLHQQSQINHDNQLEEIVATLGGIDQILIDYLSSKDISLNVDQLNKLQNILNTADVRAISGPKSQSEDNDCKQLTYTYIINDSYYHHLFGDKMGSKIMYYVYHKMYWIFSLSIYLLALISDSFSERIDMTAFIIFRSVAFVWGLIVAISAAIAVNKTVFNASIKHFVFWLKIGAALQVAVCAVILNVYIIPNQEASVINISCDMCRYITTVVVITNFSAIDGHCCSNQIKIMIGFVGSLLYSYRAIISSLFVDYEKDLMVNIGFVYISISSLYASALRVLSIFMWKQTILIMLKKDKCINIRYSPIIKWIKKWMYI